MWADYWLLVVPRPLHLFMEYICFCCPFAIINNHLKLLTS